MEVDDIPCGMGSKMIDGRQVFTAVTAGWVATGL
jgi:hypothetical protein